MIEHIQHNIKFINTIRIYKITIKKSYLYLYRKKIKKKFYINILNEFDSNITKFKIMVEMNHRQCRVIIEVVYQEINEFGDGLNIIFLLYVHFYACENGYLFIDE